MLSSRSFWSSRHFPLLAPDGDGGGNGGSNAGAESDSKAGDGDTGDKGKESSASKDGSKGDGEKGDDKEALRRMGEQRDAARADLKKLQDELETLRKEKQEREEAEAAAKDKEAAERGEFEKLAEKRGKDLDAAKADVTRLTSENDQLKAAMAEGLEARLKELPEKVRKVLDETVDAEDVLARWNWLHKPSVQELIKAETERGDPVRGNGRDPKGAAAGKPELKPLINVGSFI